MRIVALMLVMDRRNTERLRAVPVITYRTRTDAEDAARIALRASLQGHAAKVAAAVGVSPA